MPDLWAWAVAAWERPGVESACLEFQDRTGHSVALALWRCWCAAEGRPVRRALRQSAVDLSRSVETAALAPMRAVRRAVAHGSLTVDPAAKSDAARRISQAELTLERALLDALQAMSAAPAERPRSVRAEDIFALMEAWTGCPPDAESRGLVVAVTRALG